MRFVQERRRGAGEHLEGRLRAVHVSDDADLLFQQAAARCTDAQVLARQNVSGALVTWAIPSVD
jgi:hypothetical protein